MRIDNQNAILVHVAPPSHKSVSNPVQDRLPRSKEFQSDILNPIFLHYSAQSNIQEEEIRIAVF